MFQRKQIKKKKKKKTRFSLKIRILYSYDLNQKRLNFFGG